MSLYWNDACDHVSNSADLYIDGTPLLSQEGAVQDDPLAMASIYALATVLLSPSCKIDRLTGAIWFADNAAGGGNLLALCEWVTHTHTHTFDLNTACLKGDAVPKGAEECKRVRRKKKQIYDSEGRLENRKEEGTKVEDVCG